MLFISTAAWLALLDRPTISKTRFQIQQQ